MNALLSIMYPLFHLILALLEWGLLGWAIALWRKSNSLAMIVLPIVLFSLSYDNLVLAFGSLIGEGELLKTLSAIRFVLHNLVVPLFIAIGVELARRAGADWATRNIQTLSWIVALTLSGIGLSMNFMALELKPVHFAGVLRYVSAQVTGPPIITIAVNSFVLLIGIGLWYRLQWQWLFWGTAIAFIGNIVPSVIVGTLPSSLAEFILAFSLFLTERRTQILDRQENPDPNHNTMIRSNI